MAENEREVFSLDSERSRKFLETIAAEPFLTVVVTSNEVVIYGKDIESDHLDRIKNVLVQLTEEGEHG